MNFWIAELISVVLQFVLFIPLYFEWRKDCKEIGKDMLAVPLHKRFLAWVALFPLWIIPAVCLAEGR